MATEKKNTILQNTVLISFIAAIFVAYPNLAWVLCDLDFTVKPGQELGFALLFIFRFFVFVMLIFFLLKYDLKKIREASLYTYLEHNGVLTLIGFLAYELITHLLPVSYDHFLSIIVFQFIFLWLIGTAISYIDMLYEKQRKNDLEIEQLKAENLESRCNALTNQINPHFFFNSLNGISALVRKKDDANTLEYIDELSRVFRYILQSEKRNLVSLSDELQFVEAFKKIMQVRYANRLIFDVDVPIDEQEFLLPVLSLLPLMENVITHNVIDSEHIVTLSIRLNGKDELVIQNPIYKKLTPPATHGTGLKNLQKRFELLTGKSLRTEHDEKTFTVYLPLLKEE